MAEHLDYRIYGMWLWDRGFDRDYRDVLIRGARHFVTFVDWRFFFCLT